MSPKNYFYIPKKLFLKLLYVDKDSKLQSITQKLSFGLYS